VANGSAAARALHHATRTIPVIFVLVADPIGLGCVESLRRPGSNMTGLTFFDPPLVGKWFQLLKEVSPRVVAASFIFNPGTAGFYFKFLEGLPGLGSQISLTPVRDLAELENVLAELAKS